MTRTCIKNLHDYTAKEVTIAGWVDARRDHGKLIFIDVRDRTGKVQMVALPNHKGVRATADDIRLESVIEVRGKVNKRSENMVNKDLSMGDVELEALEITILNKAQEMPFDKDADLNLDTLLDHRPLTLRRERERAIFKIQSVIVNAYRSALHEQCFTEFQAPSLVGGDAEGGADIFNVEYFNDKTAYLATSPQLYKQIMVGVYERVFTTTNVFRAEKHNTSRHLNEYVSLDAEMGFIGDHQDVMKALADAVINIATTLKKDCGDEFKSLGATFPTIPEDFPQMKLRAAQALIRERTGEDCTAEPDLSPEHERWLSQYATGEFDSDVLFITHYPVEKRPFYTLEDPDDPGYTKSFDLIFRGLEIATGGQRIHDYKTLEKKLAERGLDPHAFSFYLEAFQYGMPPHGGWGMGLERLTARLLNLDNVREATLFPRDMNRIDTLFTS